MSSSSSTPATTRLDRSLPILLYNENAATDADDTPSRRTGISAATERGYRTYGTGLLWQAATLLFHNTKTMTPVSACVLFHRYYHRTSLQTTDVWATAMGCLFLACKLHQVTDVTARHVIVVFGHLYRRRRRWQGSMNAEESDNAVVVKGGGTTTTTPWTASVVQPMLPTGPVWQAWLNALVKAEGQILRELGFIVYWIPHSTAHAFLPAFVEALLPTMEDEDGLAERAWYVCNDAYRWTDACVRYDAAVMCTAAILIALRPGKEPTGAWWIPLIGADQEQALADCTNLLLECGIGGGSSKDGDEDDDNVLLRLAEVAFLPPLCRDSFNGPDSFLWAMQEEEGTV